MRPTESLPLLLSWARMREPTLWRAWCCALVTLMAVAFLAPALELTFGYWPAPLDDVYIYFGFARSLALGHGLSWVPGNGYSSGSTSLLYPLLLAPGWALGLRGSWLGLWATLLAVLFLCDLARSLRAIVGSRLVAWLMPPLLLSVPLLDWSWFSGMETALFGAVLGRALRAAHDGRSAEPPGRRRAQRRAGAWLAALALVRPETTVLALPLALYVAWHGRALSAVGSLARSLGPLGATMALQALANRWWTGELAPAGAIRKLLGSNPHLDTPTLAIEVLKNLVVLEHQALDRALGSAALGGIVPALGLVGIVGARHRGLALALLSGAAGLILAVSLNSTARFQNYRYATPALAMLLVAAALGLDTIARWLAPARANRGVRRAALGAVACLGLLACVAPAGQLRGQIDHFARASRNIAEQQVEVARRLRRMQPRPTRVLVNDAGAVAYLSELPALDGLGLGGFRRLPFARASVHGVPAVVELIERLGAEDRPDWFALYPGWWPGLVDHFGTERDAVRITDNVICAAEEKVIYQADWGLLAAADEQQPGALDQLDVADLVDEREHRYELPSPRAGWVMAAVHQLEARDVCAAVRDAAAPSPSTGRPLASSNDAPRLRWDAGRIAPVGATEELTLRTGAPPGGSRLVMRTDPTTIAKLRVALLRGETELEATEVEVRASADDAPRQDPRPAATSSAGSPARWRAVEARLGDVAGGDRVRITVTAGEWRSYHYWLCRP